MDYSRRSFLALAAAMALAAKGASEGDAAFDENLSVFVSDIHVSGTEPEETSTQRRLASFVDEVLAMRPRPRRVVSLGDLAYLWGRPEDYAASKPHLARLAEAGIDLVFCMGNHDRRAAFAQAWPGVLEKSPVPGRFVSVSSLGTCDLVILDGLQGTDGRGEKDMGPGTGLLTPDQVAWIKAELPKRTRPFLVASHFPVHELAMSAKKNDGLARWLLKHAPMCRGYVHGHDHRWRPEWVKEEWTKSKSLRTVCLPSCGLWGDIGWAVVRTSADRAVCALEIRDFYFPREPKTSARPGPWRAKVEDHRGQKVTFLYDREGV